MVAAPGPARAQFGLGAGWGWGMFGVQPSPSTQLLNQHALNRASAGRPAARSHAAYSGNPNAYFNRARDNGFVSHYDVQRRRAPSYQTVRTTPSASREHQESQPAQARAILPLASFFNASLKLVWPQESPVDGEFGGKREISDQAALAVLKETRQRAVASLSGVAEAREKLLDYGRPALKHIRAMATPPIADSFHRFLLSLYDSLEAAAQPPDNTPVRKP